MKHVRIISTIFLLLVCKSVFAESYKKGEIFYDLLSDEKYSGIVDGYSQDVDERGVGTSYQVDHKSYFDYVIEVKNGVRDGTSKLYKKYQRVINGESDKIIERYLHTEVKFVNGKILWIKEYNEDGSIRTVTKLSGGVAERYSKNGHLVSKFSYVIKGEFPYRKMSEVYKDFLGNPFAMHGEFIVFYKDGSVRKKHTYRLNQRHGSFISFHDNGSVFQKGSYAQGKMDGEYILKCEDGRLSKHAEYFMGDEVKVHVDNGSNFCWE